MTNDHSPVANMHKKKTTSRSNENRQDRESIQRTLALSKGPLDPEQHPNGKLLNIATGEVMHGDITVHAALQKTTQP